MNKRGFTLIELLIVVAILGIIGPILYKMRSDTIYHQRDQIWQQRAVWALEDQATLVNIEPYSELKEGAHAPFEKSIMAGLNIPSGNGEISIERISSKLKKINLELRWNVGSNKKRIKHLTIYRYKE